MADSIYVNDSDMCGKLYKIGKSPTAVNAGQWWFQFAVSFDKWTVNKLAATTSYNCQAKITIEANEQMKGSYGGSIIDDLENFVNTTYLMQGNGVYIGYCSTMTKVTNYKYEGYFDISGYNNDVYINPGKTVDNSLTQLWYNKSGQSLSDRIDIYLAMDFFTRGIVEYKTPKLKLNPSQIKISSTGNTRQELQLTENNNNIYITIDKGHSTLNLPYFVEETVIGTEAASATASTTFKTTDAALQNWRYRLKGTIQEAVHGSSSASSATYPTLIYWLDEQGGYHAKRGWTPDPTYGFDITDNGVFYNISLELGNDALTLSAVNLYKYKGATSTASFPVFVNNSRMRMRISVKVTFLDTSLSSSYSSQYTIVVKDSKQTYINQKVSKSGNSWNQTFSYDSALLTGVARDMDLKLIVTEEGYGRSVTHDLGTHTLYSYDKPEITYFDAYRSDADGTLNLNSTKITLMATWKWSECGGNNNIASRQMSINNGNNYTMNNANSAKIYWTNYTFTVGTDYNITFKVTDNFGETGTYTIALSNANVLMDFNNSGLGVAVGKLSEQNCFEVAIPAIFYQSVQYINGSRSTADAANTLGFEDNHNTGCKTIQQILDYIIVRLK